MSRDPLEGVRPQDSFEASGMRPHDALDQPDAMPQNPVARPGGRSGAKVLILVVAALSAVFAGGMTFYLTARPAARAPQPSPPRALALPTAPTPQPKSTDDMVVTQSPAPPADPPQSPPASQ